MIIISSIVAFTFIILLLVFMLLIAQKKLVQSGPVKILINGEKTLTVSAGSSLLSTLANEKIFFRPLAVEVELVPCVNASLSRVVAMSCQQSSAI